MDNVPTRRILDRTTTRRATAARKGHVFFSAERRQILRELWFSVCAGEVCALTGDAGLGKTLLCAELLNRLPHSVHAVQLTVPEHGCSDFVETLAHTLSRSRLRRFAENPAERAADRWEFRWAIVIDEAHHLDVGALARLAELRRRERDAGGIMSLLLVGRPSLNTLLRDPALSELRRELVVSLKVMTLTVQETELYIKHWFRFNCSAPIAYRESAARIIHYATGGAPRQINQLCARACDYMRLHNRFAFNALVAARAAWKVMTT